MEVNDNQSPPNSASRRSGTVVELKSRAKVESDIYGEMEEIIEKLKRLGCKVDFSIMGQDIAISFATSHDSRRFMEMAFRYDADNRYREYSLWSFIPEVVLMDLSYHADFSPDPDNNAPRAKFGLLSDKVVMWLDAYFIEEFIMLARETLDYFLIAPDGKKKK